MYSDLPHEDLGSTDVADDSAASDEAPVLIVSGGAPEAEDVGPTADPIAEDVPAIVRRPTPLFSVKSEMARAMQVVADQERARINAGVGDEETTQVDKIHVRATAEASQLSKHADEDVALVNAWYVDQVKQLREAADHQIDDRRKGLDEALTDHGSLIAAEVQSVHTAVEDYRGSLDAFFGRLAEEQDPSVIARLAGTLPDLPDLDAVRAVARSRSRALRAIEDGWSAETVAPGEGPDTNGEGPDTNGDGHFELERELVPVMDPQAVRQRVTILSGMGMPVGRPGPWSAAQEASSQDESSGDATASEVESAEAAVTVPAAAADDGSTIWTSANGDQEGA